MNQQIKEELWELYDQETVESIANARSGKAEEYAFDDFIKDYNMNYESKNS